MGRARLAHVLVRRRVWWYHAPHGLMVGPVHSEGSPIVRATSKHDATEEHCTGLLARGSAGEDPSWWGG